MGSSESKQKANNGKEAISSSEPSTPIKSTNSNSENLSHLDPRSPSDDIFRTPLEIAKERNEKVISHVKHVVDPRSPSDQFARTPILIKENQSNDPKILHNKILDNARRNITYSPVITPKSKSILDTPKGAVSPPKLISSIPTFAKCMEKRKSFVGLLETNIDFTETNLDDIVRNKSLDKSLTINVTETSLCQIVEHKNCDPRSPSKEFLRTPIQIVQKVGEVDIMDISAKCNDGEVPTYTVNSLLKLADEENLGEAEQNDSVSNDAEERRVHVNPQFNPEIITVENAGPIQIELNNIEKNCEIETVTECAVDNNKIENTEKIMAEIVEDLIGNISILTTEESKVVPYIEKEEVKEPIIDLTADVQEFDKKLTKIIHENNENFSFKKIISKEHLTDKPKKRTPMKDRNQISEPKKNQLKVSDKPRKLNYDISKIPVFRDRNGMKTKVQCENTPPNNMKLRKRKNSQPKWDSDKTLVI